jgi:hypothetical protein
LQEAVNRGFDFLAITDHRNVNHLFDENWHSDKLLLISGIEWGGGGHANMFGLRTDNTCNYDDYDDVISSWKIARLQGAIQSLNHYADDTNYWDTFIEARPELISMLNVYEAWNVMWPANGEKNVITINYLTELRNKKYKITSIGGSDTHYEAFPMGWPTTYVYAKKLSQLQIFDGFRKGRTYIVNPYPYYTETGGFSSDPISTLEFNADTNGDGKYEAMIGDTVSLGNISFYVKVTNAYGPIIVKKNGNVLQSFTGHSPGSDAEYYFTDTPSSYSWYIVEMHINDLDTSDMLLLSSPIYAE